MKKTIQLALCTAVLAMTIAAPAEAGYRKYKQCDQHQTVQAPLFLGVGY